MKLTEPEMRMAYQLESTSQVGVLNEPYMTCRYSRDEDTKATAEVMDMAGYGIVCIPKSLLLPYFLIYLVIGKNSSLICRK